MTSPPKIPQVAILISTYNDWGRRVVKGVLSYAKEVGPWHIWVKPQPSGVFSHIPEGWRGDGVIASITNQTLANELMHCKLPVVNVHDEELQGVSAPSIRTDDRQGCRIAINHFLGKGIRQLAFVGPNQRPNQRHYCQLFQEEAYNHGLDCQTHDLNHSSDEQTESLAKWLKALPKPCGVLALGNIHARETIECCLRSKIQVPHDLCILCSTYDELLNNACFPALSGLLPPTEQIGYQAAKMIHKMILGKKVSNHTTRLAPRGIIEQLSTETLAVKDLKLAQIIDYLREHALEPITIKDVLKQIPMSRRTMEARFEQTFGHTPTDEIRRIRIDKARQLLVETDKTMQDIAEACGYSTYNYLTSVFKKSTGSTPSEYRRKYRS